MSDMPDKEQTLVERLARHLAILDPVPGSGGWKGKIDAATGILAVIKLPDRAMRAAGDSALWGAMIDAALVSRWEIGADAAPSSPPPGGTDEEGDVPIPSPDALEHDPSSWIQFSVRSDPACPNKA
jgi:hypothetical protein